MQQPHTGGMTRPRTGAAVAGGLALLMLTGCASSKAAVTAKATVASPAGTFATELLSTPAPPPLAPASTEPPAPLEPGASADAITDLYSHFTVAVGPAIGIAVRSATEYEVGFPVTITSDAPQPDIAAANFELSPLSGVTGTTQGGDPAGLVSLSDYEPDVPCRDVPPLTTALYDVTSGRVTGCVVFTYKPTDKPSRITYYMLGRDEDQDAAITWQARIKVKPVRPVTGIEYRVTSDGGISSVTYSTAGFNQEQDTSVQGTKWSKKLADDMSLPILVAQNAGGGAISCTILWNGHQIARQTSRGQYAVVTCSANG